MDDAKNWQEPTEENQADETEAIARLLRLAGPRPGVPADREARLRSAAHAHWSTSVRKGRRLRWAVWTSVSLAAASVLIFIGTLRGWRVLDILPVPGSVVATVLRVEGFQNVPASQAPAAGAELKSRAVLATGAGDRVALQMRGGAVVRVDSGTRLRLISPSLIDLDSGAIYVDSGPSGKAGHPLEIRTRLGIVRDVGTQFQVRVGQDGIQVSVREGIARLEREGASHDATAGIELSLKDDGALTSRTIPSTGGEWDWILGLSPAFPLEGSPLAEYLAWVGRETGLRIEFQDPSVEAEAPMVILHGSIEGLRPEETLAAVLPTCGMAYAIDGDTLMIRRGSQKSAP
ncbi:MAG: FecR family protein [Acidobacteria bacterium]|nr:FecR family protein [Acidobacteriota bacterium]